MGLRAYRTTLQESIKYKNEEIKRTTGYCYLGIYLNNKLEYQKMADYIISKGMETFKTIGNKHEDRRVPMIFKKMIIRNILLPRISYGLGVYGLRYYKIKK